MPKLIDLTGQTFGRLTVLERVENNKENEAHWKCKCVCGNIVNILGSSLRSGRTKSCGCMYKKAGQNRRLDIKGQVFGRLKVIEKMTSNKGDKTSWKCRCSCGNSAVVRTNHLRAGLIKSCGCLQKESTKKRSTIHNMAHTVEYNVWTCMLQRCQNSNNPAFENYGGRGIKVCDEWKNDFVTFFNHIGKRPSPKYSLDRIDNDKGYTPKNTQWATPIEQSNNRRSSRKITINGESKTLAQWAKCANIKPGTIQSRLQKGWPPEKAIFQPVRKRDK